MTPDEQARSLANLKLERDAIVLYDQLSELEHDPRRAAAFRSIAANERRHAEIWATRLREDGATVPPADDATTAHPLRPARGAAVRDLVGLGDGPFAGG